MEPSHHNIIDILEELTAKFLKLNNLKTPYDINCGYCEEWATEVSKKFPSAEMVGTPEWYWFNRRWAVGHTWIVIKDKCYDAETTNGVRNWKNLTPFRNARKKLELRAIL